MIWEVLRMNVSFVCRLGQEECFSGEGWDPLTVLYVHFSRWSCCLLSNVSRLRLMRMVVTDPGCLCDRSWLSRAVVSSDEASCTVLDLF